MRHLFKSDLVDDLLLGRGQAGYLLRCGGCDSTFCERTGVAGGGGSIRTCEARTRRSVEIKLSFKILEV